MSKAISTEFIRRIPKTDLHVHLGGSMRLSTLIELAKKHTVKLPAETEERTGLPIGKVVFSLPP